MSMVPHSAAIGIQMMNQMVMTQNDGFHTVGAGRNDIDGRADHFFNLLDVVAGGLEGELVGDLEGGAGRRGRGMGLDTSRGDLRS